MFEGPAAREKAIQKSISTVQDELMKGQDLAKESLALADQHLE